MTKPTLLAIDGDSLFYDAFSTPPERQRSGFAPVHRVGVSYVPTEINDEILAKGYARVKARVRELHERLYGPEVMVAVKGDGNFRYGVHAGYKSGRAKSRTILTDLANETIRMAIDDGFAIPAHGKEADDLVRMWCWEAAQEGRSYVAAHMDKDLNCIPGSHYNYRTNALYQVSEEAALRHYHKQLIMGDSTDSIPGAKGIGEVKAERFLDDAKTREELQVAVVEAYMTAHPDDWVDQLNFNGKLLHMWRFEGDMFDAYKWEVVQDLG